MQDWLLKADLSSGAKLTYSVLACCAGGKDHAWPDKLVQEVLRMMLVA